MYRIYLNIIDEIDRFKSLQTTYTSAIKEASYLKELVQNTELLKGRIIDLESKLERSKEIQTKYHSLQIEYNTLQEEKKRW